MDRFEVNINDTLCDDYEDTLPIRTIKKHMKYYLQYNNYHQNL